MDKTEIKQTKRLEKEKLKAMSKPERKAYKAEQREIGLKNYEEYETNYQASLKEKENNIDKHGGFSKFWFKFVHNPFFEWLRKVWKKFSHIHPTASKLIYQIFYFVIFSQGVTVVQYLIMLFLPQAFGLDLAGVEFVWPQVELWTWSDGSKMIWGIFNEPVKYIDGTIAIGGGVGNFIAFEIAVFVAQCINFPLQRNITYRSHGNPWWQGMWYFIGWILISLFVNALWGFLGPICNHVLTDAKALTDLLKTFVTGGLSMVIFFFIFKLIFPEGEVKKEENK